MHYVLTPLNPIENRWILVQVTPSSDPLAPPGLIVVAEGCRDTCYTIREQLLGEMPTFPAEGWVQPICEP